MNPRISVVIPTFNRAELLMRAIASVVDQTMPEFEVIVIDDGSTDDTAKRVEALGDTRIRHVTAAHCGAAAARNRGLEEATADIVAFLDSDDEAEPEWLERITAPFEAPDVGITCVGYRIVDGATGRVGAARLPQNEGPLYCDQVVNYLAGTFAARRGILLAVGGYRDQPARQQKELGRRITRHALEHEFRIVAVAEPLIRWHQHTGPRISTDADAVYAGTLATIEHEGATIRTTSRREYARLQRSAAFNAMRVGRPRDAARHLLRAIRSDPRDWRAYVRLGESSAAIVRARVRRS